MISIIYKCADKTLPFKFIGVALCLLKFNSQWKMHHCIVLCLVILLCVLCKPIIMLNTFTIFYVLFLRTNLKKGKQVNFYCRDV